MDFVAIAVESAKWPRNFIYSIGMVKYQNGKKVDTFYSLVKLPEPCLQPYSDINLDLDTIEELKDAPAFPELWESKILPFIGDFLLVTHDKGFDIDFLLAYLEWYGMPSPVLKHFYSLQLARHAWPSLKCWDLPVLSEKLGIKYKAISSLAEAEFYGEMILLAAKKFNCVSLDKLLKKTKTKINIKVKSYAGLWSFRLNKSLKDLDINDLEQLAVDLYEDYRHYIHFTGLISQIIDKILWERNDRLDSNHEWSEENVNKLISANDLLVSSAKKGHDKAQSIIKKLDIKRGIHNQLIDYEIEIKLIPYISGYVDPEEDLSSCFMYVLCEPLDNKYLLTFDEDDDKYFDKSNNWNVEYFCDENGKTLDCFKDVYISYAIHELLDAHWCFHDIMNINKVEIEVKVNHKHYTTLQNKKNKE